MSDDMITIDDFDLFRPLEPEQFDYYLRLWGYLEIKQLEPVIKSDAGTGDSSSENTSSNSDTKTIYVDLEDGWIMHFNPGHIAVSVADNDRTFSTKKLLEAAKIGIQILQQGGAKKVALEGLDIAKLAAWIECQQVGIEVHNFDAALFNAQITRIKKIRKLMLDKNITPQP